jgi:DNA invertase Pin-like site-specific DNA recombinase
VEVESGKNTDRPKLAEALRLCRVHSATLVIAKLDRLSRDAHFLLGLEKAGVDFVAADMPHANRLTVGIMAMVADEERRMSSRRTKDVPAAAKARGVKLGGIRSKHVERWGERGNLPTLGDKPREVSREIRSRKAAARGADLKPILAEIRASGATSLGQIAKALNERGIRTPHGAEWQAVQVKRVLGQSSISY